MISIENDAEDQDAFAAISEAERVLDGGTGGSGGGWTDSGG